MIRVLQVIGVMDRGGAETMIMNLYRAMDRDKVQFDFLVHEQREGDYDAEIRRLGGRVFHIPRFTGINERSYRMQCRELFAEHAEWPIVHGHIGSCAPIYLGEAKRSGRYVVAHSHAQKFGSRIGIAAYKLVACPIRYIADYYMACSYEAGLDRFGKRIVKGNRFAIVPNGIDLSRYKCDARLHELSKLKMNLTGIPVFGHVGRLAPEKNHVFLLQVFNEIHQFLPNAVLLLAGRGPLENNLRSQVASMGLLDSVRFLGVCDNVPELLRAMDVFLFPSTSEGLALAAVEAQASGLPCLMSTGVPEMTLMTPNSERLALSEGVEAWASRAVAAYDRASADPRRDATASVRTHGFDIVDTSNKLLRFYENVCEGNGRA